MCLLSTRAAEFSFKSDFATSYLHGHNEGISSKIILSEQLLKSSQRGANRGTYSALPPAESPDSGYGGLLRQGSTGPDIV